MPFTYRMTFFHWSNFYYVNCHSTIAFILLCFASFLSFLDRRHFCVIRARLLYVAYRTVFLFTVVDHQQNCTFVSSNSFHFIFYYYFLLWQWMEEAVCCFRSTLKVHKCRKSFKGWKVMDFNLFKEQTMFV